MSDAVTEFSYQRDAVTARANAVQSDKRIGFFAHELRNLLGTASLAFAAAKAGNLSFSGATGAMLERTLMSLEKLIARSLEDVRMLSNAHKISLLFRLENSYLSSIPLAPYP